jgi:aspartyl/asparaginyl beta-hydroxylase (cupin superfamily)
MNCNNKLMATYKKFGFILCCLLLFLILIGVLFEKDRKFGNSRYNPSSYYITLWPLPILGMYNTIVRSLNPDHIHSFDVNTFPSNTPNILQSGWRDIQMEAINLYKKKEKLRNMSHIGTMSNFDVLDVEEGQWKVFVLKWYGKTLENAKRQCPKTVEMIEQCTDLHIAMISILEPGKYIPPHKGPFTACLRYHLGLKIPKDRENCYIEVNNEKFTWGEGEGLIFDDTYNHSVYNNTDEPRIILFVDIERPLKQPLKSINNFLCSNASLAKFNKGVNDVSEKTKELFMTYDHFHY